MRREQSRESLYNQELRSQRIEITQFTLLMALHQTGEISQGKLGKLLALDSTTLTRMLDLLKKRGWVQEKEGDDRRFRIIRLTTAGRRTGAVIAALESGTGPSAKGAR